MTVYEVLYGTESHAWMCLQADGRIAWTIDPVWHDFWVDASVQEAIEKVMTTDPSTTVFDSRGFTIRQRQEPPGEAPCACVGRA